MLVAADHEPGIVAGQLLVADEGVGADLLVGMAEVRGAIDVVDGSGEVKVLGHGRNVLFCHSERSEESASWGGAMRASGKGPDRAQASPCVPAREASLPKCSGAVQREVSSTRGLTCCSFSPVR